MNKKAFTLIELIVTILIMGLLAMIIIPLVSNYINSSKRNSFEESAKRIAAQIKNLVVTGDIIDEEIDCMGSEYGTYNDNYSSCIAHIYYGDDGDVVSVDVVGKNNYAGLTIIGAREDTSHIIDGASSAQSLKTVLLATVSGKDISVNKYAGNGLYKWGSKYIYRGGITKTNAAGLATNAYASDVDSGTDVSNFVQVPWETYTVGETCTSTSNKCWRVMSIDALGNMTIIRDKNEVTQAIDTTHNTAASTNYYNLYLSNPTTYASYANALTTNYGYNDILANVPPTDHPEEYRAFSSMYTKLYGGTGYEATKLLNYESLLKPLEMCLNKINAFAGLNSTDYATTTRVTDTCNVSGKTGTTAVEQITNKYVRIPYSEEYLNASLESTCTQDSHYQCRNQNFMYNKQTYWTPTGYSSLNWATRIINSAGQLNNYASYSGGQIRPIVTLKSTVLILSGDTGTAADPYIIKW